MKKLQSLALTMFAAFALASCSSDEPNDEQYKSNGEPRYLSVNIIPTSANGSRSTDGGYENGTGNENKVTKVRFYFFTEGGDPAKVKYENNAYKSYYDWTNPDEGTTNGEGSNVEKYLKPVIIISTPQGDKLPSEVIAVLNPDESNLDNNKNYTREELRIIYADYAKRATDGTFTMANSVYANGNEVIKSTKLSVSNFHKSSSDAEAAPVDIYVERCVAKVRAKYNSELVFTENGLLRAKTKPENGRPSEDITIHGTDKDIEVYIKIEGWNLTYTMPYANISKHIDLSWNNNILGDNVIWSKPEEKRSFWASQNIIDGSKHVHVPWNSANAQNFTNGQVYANENAERKGDSGIEPTHIIVAATLCDKTGKALTVCEFSGLKFADDDDFSALKGMVLTYLNNGNTSYYKEQTVEGGKKYVKIAQEDITFVQNKDATSDKYKVYAKLTETAEGYTWVTATSDAGEITDPSQITPVSGGYTNINTQLKNQGYALIYNGGKSYYFAPIKHYTRNGVVRNHIYDITVDGFYGMGTPVYDPSWGIILEKPSSDDAYLAAKIQILAWHCMQSNITFD